MVIYHNRVDGLPSGLSQHDVDLINAACATCYFEEINPEEAESEIARDILKDIEKQTYYRHKYYCEERD